MGWANKYVLVRTLKKKIPEKVFLFEIFYTVFPQGISQEKNFIQINTKKVYNLVPPSRKIMIMPWNYHLSAIQVVCNCCASPWILPCHAIQYQLFEKNEWHKIDMGGYQWIRNAVDSRQYKKTNKFAQLQVMICYILNFAPPKYPITTLPVNYNAVKLAYFFSIQQKTLYLKQNAI